MLAPSFKHGNDVLQKARRMALRNRASAACLPCKTRKTRCNDYRPCKNCKTGNELCNEVDKKSSGFIPAGKLTTILPPPAMNTAQAVATTRLPSTSTQLSPPAAVQISAHNAKAARRTASSDIGKSGERGESDWAWEAVVGPGPVDPFRMDWPHWD
jgi:hypothetical protein